METIRFSSLNDWEAFAQKRIDRPTFEHLLGPTRPEDHQSDFKNIKLKLRGMANLKYFKGLNTHVLVRPTSSPICIGPLPPISDLKMTATHGSDYENMIQNVCK